MNENFKEIQEKAEQGDAQAQYELGICYYNGKGVPQDYEKAVFWFRKAAEQGSADGQFWLGRCYDRGEGISQDCEQAVFWFRKAAEQGNAEAQTRLGVCYSFGEGIPQDYEKAVYWYTKSAEQGNDASQYNLGICHYFGNGVSQDYEQAVFWFRKAAEQGDLDAQNNLGFCYCNEDGVPLDYEKAVYWFEKAAEQGDDASQYNLGRCYYFGNGVSQDYEQAVFWFRKAAEQGHSYAQNNLGICYYNEKGVPQDYEKAVFWFRKAAEQGNADGQFWLGRCYHYGYGVEKSYYQEVFWYKKAIEQNHSMAQHNLGNCYLYGYGVPVDIKEATYWFLKSAKQGESRAIRKLNQDYKYTSFAFNEIAKEIFEDIDTMRSEGQYQKALELIREELEIGNKWNISAADIEKWNISDSVRYLKNELTRKKIRILIDLNEIEEALFLVDYQIKQEGETGSLCRLKAICLEKQRKPYEAILYYQKAKEYFTDRDSQKYLLERINVNYGAYIEDFQTVAYPERKVILISNTGTYFKADNLLVLNDNRLPNLSFPISHPKRDTLYVGHPYNSGSYLPVENYDYELLNDRINEYCYVLQCLGATEIEITNVKGESRDVNQNIEKSSNENYSGEISGGVRMVKASVGGSYSTDKENKSVSKQNNSSFLRIGRHQYFNPTQKPYIPKDVVWLPNEASWKRLVQQRMSGQLLEHREMISSQSSQVLSTSDISNIKKEFNAFLKVSSVMAKLDVKGGYTSDSTDNKFNEIKNNENSEWSVRVVFKPLEEFEGQIIELPQQSVSPQIEGLFTIDEQKLIDQLEKAFEDGIITDMEERILKRLQQRFAISDARYEELKNYVRQSQMLTEDERAYLEEYQIANQNNDISDEEREFLRSFALQLGISPERVEEIEKKA